MCQNLKFLTAEKITFKKNLTFSQSEERTLVRDEYFLQTFLILDI
jgi:hypothetical protein